MAQQLPQQSQPVTQGAGYITRPWFLFLSGAASGIIPGTVYAGLPVTPQQGAVSVITDATVNTWGTTIAGGGAFTVLAWYNGTDWTVIGI